MERPAWSQKTKRGRSNAPPPCLVTWSSCHPVPFSGRSRRSADPGHLPQLFFFVDDDAGRDHHHEALALAAIADVLEEPIDVRDLAQDRRSEFVAAFRHPLQTAQQHRAAV